MTRQQMIDRAVRAVTDRIAGVPGGGECVRHSMLEHRPSEGEMKQFRAEFRRISA